MTSIGVGLIGTGYMGKCHALAWNAVRPVFGDGPQPRLVHLAEVSADLAAQRADEFGFEKSTGDWRTLIVDPAVEVVSITTPNAFHAEMAIAALAAGKHVWCEKPMAVALTDAEGMAAAAHVSGKVTALGYNYIQNPVIRHIAKLLGEAPSAPSTTSASRWTRTTWPIPRRRSAGRARPAPAFAPSSAPPTIRPMIASSPPPGHGLGFNELNIIECHELLAAIAGKPAQIVDFAKGLEIERAVHAMAESHRLGRWVGVV